MRKLTIGLFALLLFSGVAHAQLDSEKLARLPDILRGRVGQDIPGWTHRSITPMEGSKNVIVEVWESGNVVMKVVVTEYKTQADAVDALKEFKNN